MRLFFLLTSATAMAAPAVKWGNAPLSFEPNAGQASQEVRYLARGSRYTLSLGRGETVLAGRNQARLRTKFSGANPGARIEGEAPQPSTSNYLVGSDQGNWRTGIANYERVRYAGVYRGIDLV